MNPEYIAQSLLEDNEDEAPAQQSHAQSALEHDYVGAEICRSLEVILI